MKHLQSYTPRNVLRLPTEEVNGWQLKRYGIFAKDRVLDSYTTIAALDSAIERLPKAGKLHDPSGNHGVGFQLIHFAEDAVVSPVFYWIWGSVIANTDQIKAQWGNTNTFETGVKEVVGCVWELQILCFESQAWTETMLSGTGIPTENLTQYLERSLPSSETEK